MTKDEALKLALEALRMADELCRGHGVDFKEYGLEFDRDIQVKYKDAITAIKEALAQPAQEPVDCYGYAARLATSIWKQHYQKTAPQWQVLDDLIGVLTQIDNMAAGLISTPLPVQPDQSVAGYCKKIGELIAERDRLRAALAQPVQPEQEPVAWEQFHEHLVERNFCPRCGKRTADLTTIHTCTPPVAADS